MNTEFKLRLIIKFEVKWRSKLEPNKNKLERPSSANGMIVGFSQNDDIMTAELIKSWIVRDIGEGKNQPAHRILRGRLSRKTYLLFRFPIILRYFLKSEKSKHGPSVEFLEIKGVDRPMQRLS